MASRTLVKLDDYVVEIKEKGGKLVATKLDENDEFEVSMLQEGVEKMLENDVNKLANEAYAELQKSFKHTLKGNVLRIVGFDNHWNDQKWEVDHCNGRNSVLTEYISEKVKQLFRTEFDQLLQPEIDKMLVPAKAALVKDFKEHFNRAVKEHIRNRAQEAAKLFLVDVLGKEVKKLQKKAIAGAEEAFLGRKIPVELEDE